MAVIDLGREINFPGAQDELVVRVDASDAALKVAVAGELEYCLADLASRSDTKRGGIAPAGAPVASGLCDSGWLVSLFCCGGLGCWWLVGFRCWLCW